MSGPQLDIDAIEATVAALTEEAGEGGTLIERDVPALCAEVRHLRRMASRFDYERDYLAHELASRVGETKTHWVQVSGDAYERREALFAAVTPTPQDPRPKLDDTDGGECEPVRCVVCVLTLPPGDPHGGLCCEHRYDEQPQCHACRPVTSTPEAATEPTPTMIEQAESTYRGAMLMAQARHDSAVALYNAALRDGIDVNSPILRHRRSAAPSGLQRATEQQELECQFCGTPGADCTDDTGCCSYCAHEPVGGSDTPADQPEPHQNYGLEVEWGYRYPNGGNVYAQLSREQAEAAAARVPGSALYRRDPRWLPVAAAPAPADQPDDEPCDLTEIIATIRAAKTDAHAGGPLAKWLAMVYGPRARRRALAPSAPADQPEQDVQR